MIIATLNGIVIARNDATIFLEGNHYFPPDSVDWEHLQKSDTKYVCPWKGECDYYNVIAGDETAEDGAWCYSHPKADAVQIAEHVAFAPSVEVREHLGKEK